MADKKISALTSATTPLDGTEVLPIVQSSATVKVANNDLRPKQIQSNATSGVLQVAGPGAAATRVMTTPDANFTAARTDAAQVLTGDQSLTTGNIVQVTAAKGINFTANSPQAGMTSRLLNWYEEGTWTPIATSGTGAITAYTSSARYTRVGRLVKLVGVVTLTTVGTAGGNLVISGLPFTVANITARNVGLAREESATGVCYQYLIDSGGTTSIIQTLTGTAPLYINGYSYSFSAVYEI
jgi:hypothetical protein